MAECGIEGLKMCVSTCIIVNIRWARADPGFFTGSFPAGDINLAVKGLSFQYLTIYFM